VAPKGRVFSQACERLIFVAKNQDHVAAADMRNVRPADDGNISRAYPWQHARAAYTQRDAALHRQRTGDDFNIILAAFARDFCGGGEWRPVRSSFFAQFPSFCKLKFLRSDGLAIERHIDRPFASLRTLRDKRAGHRNHIVDCGRTEFSVRHTK